MSTMQTNTSNTQEKNLGQVLMPADSGSGSSHKEKMDSEGRDTNIHEQEEAPKQKDNVDWQLEARSQQLRAEAAEQRAVLLQKRLDAAKAYGTLLEEKLGNTARAKEQMKALEEQLKESRQMLAAAEARAQAAEARTQALVRQLSEELLCPITLRRFRRPVVASDGVTYERAAIRRWARQQPNSPLTREPLQGPKYENRLAIKFGGLLADVGLVTEVEEESDSASEPEELPSAAPEPPAVRAWAPSLHESIHDGQEAAALRLLQAPQVLGLNLVQDRMSVLTMAIHGRLWQVASAILTRRDFRQMNAGVAQWTALHEAAAQGHLQLCRAILQRPDFELLSALNFQGHTAAAVARDSGHEDVANFLYGLMEEAA